MYVQAFTPLAARVLSGIGGRGAPPHDLTYAIPHSRVTPRRRGGLAVLYDVPAGQRRESEEGRSGRWGARGSLDEWPKCEVASVDMRGCGRRGEG